MAQRTEKEETEFKVVPETLTPCVNNCGVIGNQATNNMCQNCFNSTTSVAAALSSSPKITAAVRRDASPRSTTSMSSEASWSITSEDSNATVAVAAKKEAKRCAGCRKKVGLTGFRCRCGELFCGEHRYSDRHACSYDYKVAGREAISRENPLVKASKIVRI